MCAGFPPTSLTEDLTIKTQQSWFMRPVENQGQTTPISPGSQHKAWPTCVVGDDGGDMKHTCHSCPQCCAGAILCLVLSPNNHLYLPTKERAVSCFYALHTPQVTKVQEHRCRQSLHLCYVRLVVLEGTMTLFIFQLCSRDFFPPALKIHVFLEEKQVVVAAFPPSGAGYFPRTKQVVSKMGNFGRTTYSKSSNTLVLLRLFCALLSPALTTL